MQLCRDREVKDSGTAQTQWRLMGIYSENRAEYVISQFACMSDSVTVAPINHHATDVVSAKKIIEHTLLEVICVSRNTLRQIVNMLSNEGLPKLNTIICFDNLKEDELHELLPESRRSNIKVLLF